MPQAYDVSQKIVIGQPVLGGFFGKYIAGLLHFPKPFSLEPILDWADQFYFFQLRPGAVLNP